MRLPVLTDADYTPRQAELAARIAGKRGKIGGPFKVWLHSPEMCDKAEALGAFVRFECSLPERIREYALLVAAREYDAQFSWNAHVAKAIETGIPATAITQLANCETPDFGEDAELALFHELAVTIMVEHFVPDELFARASATWTNQQLVDVIGLLGNFTMLAMLLNTFQVDLQPDVEPPFPDVRGYVKVASASA
jgi:4-carboxymuconolactone decarboxylase